jgi:hypothetical protein
MAKKSKKIAKNKEEDYAGLFVPAGLLIGMGMGFAFGNLVAGLFIGMGGGFLVMAIVKYLEKH